jgi:DNA gyrase/topoisomerase IV subunit B
MVASTAFRKLEHREHVLLRPGMYIGSVETELIPAWVCCDQPEDDAASAAASASVAADDAAAADAAAADDDQVSVKSGRSSKSKSSGAGS